MSVKRLARITTAALAALAVMAPVAPAKPFETGSDSESTSVAVAPERVTNGPAPAPQPSRVVVAPERVTNELPPSVPRIAGPTVVVEADDGPGFDWGAAGIGAGTILGIALLAAGGMTLAGRHGTRLRASH